MNAQVATQVAASLTLTGKGFDPKEITSALGIQPTKTWRMGSSIQNTLLKREHDGWEWSSGYVRTLNLPELVDRVLDALEPVSDKLVEVRQKLELDVELQCVVYVRDQTPIVGFSLATLERIGKLKAEIDIDLYCLAEENLVPSMDVETR